ncbi:MAG: HEAT repeat protein [bacterium ADurb.Bin363]|nr:MAG: HEAT repeat protein [bacterium ADurb.Bin363]
MELSDNKKENHESLLEEDKLFTGAIRLIKIDNLIKNCNFLEAVENLYSLDQDGLLKDESKALLTQIKNKGDYIEKGIQAMYFYKNKDYETALKYFETYLQYNPKDRKAWLLKAEIEEKYYLFEKAIESYEKLEKLTEDLTIYRKKAYCFLRLGQIQETIKCLDCIIEQQPDNKDAIEFKKYCFLQYRQSGFVDVKRDEKGRCILKSTLQKKLKIVEIILLSLIISGFLVYFLGKTSMALSGLKHEDSAVRIKSIIALRGNNREDVINKLIETLNDKNPSVRATTVRILGDSGSTKPVEYLLPLIKDKDWSVRKTTVEVLGQMKDSRATEPIIELIKNSEEQVSIRLKALHSLENIDSAKLSPLLPVLLADSQPKIRMYSARTIAKFSLKNHLSELKARLKMETDPEVSDVIVRAISKFKEKDK